MGLHDGSPIRVAVVGVGAFGKNHARVYHELQQQGQGVELVAVVDSDLAHAQAVARQFGCRAMTNIEELGGRVDAASVAVPTVYHLPVAAGLMAVGIDVLIEKPLASTLAEADELVALAKANQRIAQAGHLERFNPAVRATLPLLTRPMFFEVHRLSVFTPRSLDVDVVLDLMIHDIDVVLSFVKSPVRELRAVGLPVVSGKVDIANVRMEFDSGCVANLTASRISTERVRKLRFFQPNEYISLDYGRQDVLQFQVAAGQKFSAAQLLAMATTPGAVPIPGVSMNKPAVKSEEPLRAELKSFLQAVRTRGVPEIPLEDGRRALDVALQILAAIGEHNQRANIHVL
ncbi:MAG TPA: Gfo/Idh/MocA family oxidoreductase [Candidatus Saccharimonadales bacterium]|jgi:predicted dehydrogenase|nr:Gfo/Idh/MocA family oxidoreductase [Candidatus Saccharimonadales bacterium]